ncbi:hypothetical protein [Legionella gratiana]|nr:hypothetical protein [Legionella gratiana]
MPKEGLDPSWAFGLNQAISQGLLFGRDMIFTYGPFVFLYTKLYHPAVASSMMIVALYLSITYGGLLAFLLKNKPWYFLIFVWIALMTTLLVRDSLFYTYPLLVAIYCFNSLNTEIKPNHVYKLSPIILALLFFPFGLLPLIKGSFLVVCLGILALSFLLFISDRKWIQAITIVSSFLVSILFFWAISGQPILNLYHYFISSSAIISGYGEAMGINGNLSEIVFYLLAAFILLSLLLIEKNGGSNKLKLFIGLSFFIYLFLAFKGGFVRHDGHAMIAASALLIAAVSVFFVVNLKKASVVLFFASLACIGINIHYIGMQFFIYDIKSFYLSTWNGIIKSFADNQWRNKEFDKALVQIQEKVKFPKFKGTTDIYSYSQAYLIASKNNWNPRPVLQSYSAYTPSLAQIDKMHLLSKKSPDHLIFKLETIDSRIPSLENGPSWPIFLSYYQPSTLKNDYLYLHRRSSQVEIPKAKNIHESVYSLGETVFVPDISAPVLAEIYMEQSIFGKLMNVLYKPSQLQIVLHLKNGTTKSYRIIPEMAKSEFLISPLVEYTAEFSLLYGGVDFLRNKKVESFSIVPLGGGLQWKNIFKVVFKEMPNFTKVDIAKIHNFGHIEQSSNDHDVSFAKSCSGYIDLINDAPATSSFIVDNNLLKVQGWLVKSTESKAELHESVLLVLTDSKGKNFFIKTNSMQRPDVAASFKDLKLDASGYTALTDVSSLSGNYTLGLAYTEGDSIKICPEFKIAGTFSNSDKTEDILSPEKVAVAKQCVGYIDEINGAAATTPFIANQLINVRGWLAKSVEPKVEIPDSVFLVLTDSKGKNIFIKTRPAIRPDVGKHFKNPILDNSGYIATADVGDISGNYNLGLAYKEGNSIKICPQFKIPATFGKPDKAINISTEKVSAAKQCVGYIDEINGAAATTSFIANQSINVRGWLAKSVEPKVEIPDSVFLVLTNSKGKNIFIKTRPAIRPDVGKHFKNPILDNTGYIATADVADISGNYSLGLAYKDGNTIKICPQFKIPGIIKNAT